jgi:hypothetical protein
MSEITQILLGYVAGTGIVCLLAFVALAITRRRR